MGAYRALDAGTLTIEKLYKIVSGQDLSVMTDVWKKKDE